MAHDDFFAGLNQVSSTCWLCSHPEEGEFLDDILRGMAGEGPYASQLKPDTELSVVHRRMTDPALMEKRGLQPYPRQRTTFETHVKQHRKELWDNVEAARNRG